MVTDPGKVRNFCIIAHIDHGKSTLADRLLERAGTVTEREMKAQLLDSMDLERERGITIKSHPVRIDYHSLDGADYVFHLIDTPGHVDFHHEVSRSLAACEGALLVVDAAQGIEAQTINNLYLALEHDLEILPVLNKIDLPSARPEEVTRDVCDLIGCLPEEVARVSAKTGEGVERLMEQIVSQIPAPKATRSEPLRAIVFDSIFDAYRGTIAYVRVVDGTLAPGEKIRMMGGGQEHEVMETGYFRLKQVKSDGLEAGEVGYVATGAKSVSALQMGDTMTSMARPAAEPVIGYVEAKPMVFSGFYPIDADDYVALREALEKLQLNDAALTFEAETSAALGFGFRCGFLGLLHMEIVQERVEREYNIAIIATLPNVKYHAVLRNGEEVDVDNPSLMPDPGEVETITEPFVRASIITPKDYIGSIMTITRERRGESVGSGITAMDGERVQLDFLMPLSELVVDFFDKIKSVSRGYASLDYDFDGYQPSDLIKLDILLNGDPVDALSIIVHRDNSYEWGRELCRKLKELLPRQMYEVAIQAAIGGRVIARTNVKALRKNVTAKCYGGDVSRKRKLLDKQKAGKKRMKLVGSVEIPQEAFLAVLKVER
ncbi:elongation factor 4 [bacterium]|nr:MAG: elongation factor 4 [bacterium]